MTRISTLNSYESALADLMRAQQQQYEANKQVSTQKVATDSKGYGRTSETLTAFRSSQSRLEGFMATSQSLALRLETQNLALERAGDAANGARQAVAEAIAAGRSEALMTEISGRFMEAAEALNTRHQGRYIFAGSLVDDPPFQAANLSDLTGPPAVADLFVNDTQKTQTRLDENSSMTTGFLASELGEPLMQAFRDLQELHTGPDGPLSGPITPAQRTQLDAILQALDDAHEGLLDETARNGSLQKRVEDTMKSQEGQADTLEIMIGERTDVDMAEAITRLQQAQVAVQASAQVIAQLRNVSLLDYLR
jgi:flagellar hook-associated protein 3 FlgL